MVNFVRFRDGGLISDSTTKEGIAFIRRRGVDGRDWLEVYQPTLHDFWRANPVLISTITRDSFQRAVKWVKEELTRWQTYSVVIPYGELLDHLEFEQVAIQQ